jgi:asparaginyl-tRNA synthetase
MNFPARTSIKNVLLAPEPVAEICVKGWVRSLRRGKDVGFITLNDGSSFASLQVVFDPELSNYQAVGKLGTGACLGVRGRLVASPATGHGWVL